MMPITTKQPAMAAVVPLARAGAGDEVRPERVLTPADRLRWRVALQTDWDRKLDQLVALSKACAGITACEDGMPAERGARARRRLHARTTRAYEELAAVEDAIARLDDGKFGLCAGCGQQMPSAWLARQPAAEYCAACSLRPR